MESTTGLVWVGRCGHVNGPCVTTLCVGRVNHVASLSCCIDPVALAVASTALGFFCEKPLLRMQLQQRVGTHSRTNAHALNSRRSCVAVRAANAP